MYTHLKQTTLSTTENTQFDGGIDNYTDLILHSSINNTISNLKKLTLTIPNKEINYTRNDYFSIINNPIINNNKKKTESNISTINSYTGNQTNNCNKVKLNVEVESKKNKYPKSRNQKNVSFSNEKLWEINRVNRILHNKISNGVKSTYLRKNPSTILVKASAAINRERKNKDIVKGNEVSLINLKKY